MGTQEGTMSLTTYHRHAQTKHGMQGAIFIVSSGLGIEVSPCMGRPQNPKAIVLGGFPKLLVPP